MKIAVLTAFALASLISAASADTRDVSGFTSIGAEGRYRVEVTMGDHYVVQVDGSDANKVSTRVRNNTLEIRETGRNWFAGAHRLNAVVRVTTPRIEGLAAAKGIEMRATDIRANSLSLAAAMGAELTVSGACRDLSASAAMGAEISARGLSCDNAQVSASMGAEVDVTALHSVSASASMGADIDIAGNPETRSASASMGGDISF